jgi:hypothetical protein
MCSSIATTFDTVRPPFPVGLFFSVKVLTSLPSSSLQPLLYGGGPASAVWCWFMYVSDVSSSPPSP